MNEIQEEEDDQHNSSLKTESDLNASHLKSKVNSRNNEQISNPSVSNSNFNSPSDVYNGISLKYQHRPSFLGK